MCSTGLFSLITVCCVWSPQENVREFFLRAVSNNSMPHVGPGQSLFPLSLDFPTFYSIFYYLLPFAFFFLTNFVYFLAFSSLPILSEQSQSISRPDVIGGDFFS